MDCSVSKDGRQLSLNTHIDAMVKSFAFNTEKGSFLKDKSLAGHFTLQFKHASKIFQFRKITVRIDGHPFLLTGRFFPNVRPESCFTLPYSNVEHILSQGDSLLTAVDPQKA